VNVTERAAAFDLLLPHIAYCCGAKHPATNLHRLLVFPCMLLQHSINPAAQHAACPPACIIKSFHHSFKLPASQNQTCNAAQTWHVDLPILQGQHGQNLVFGNASYNGRPGADSWTSNTCMHPEVSHKFFGTEAANTAAAKPGMDFPSISIAASPDSWSFQHFHDRVTHIILQGQHLRGTDTTYITGREPVSSIVSALWQKLVPDAKKRVLHTSAQSWPIRAKELIFSCRAPLIHPWFAQMLAEEVGVTKWQKPLSERKVVLYCSRARDKGGRMQNGGRQFTNDDAVIAALETLLTIRGQDERLEVYDISHWERDFDGMVRYFASNIRAIIGPHGGALVNLNWAARDTAVIEVMPSDFFSLALYEHASTLGQTYGFMQSPSVNPRNDMTVDIPELMGLVDSIIGKEREEGVLHAVYDWNTDMRKALY